MCLAALVAAPASAQADFTGQWAPLYHEDTIERVPGPELGDYTGLPLNEAGRLRADSWDADRISVVQEYQCRPHSADYSLRGLAPLRISADYDQRNAAHRRRSTPTSGPTRIAGRSISTAARTRPTRRPHLPGLLDRRVERQQAHDHRPRT